MRLTTDLGHRRKTEEWEAEGAGRRKEKTLEDSYERSEAGERGGGSGGAQG